MRKPAVGLAHRGAQYRFGAAGDQQLEPRVKTRTAKGGPHQVDQRLETELQSPDRKLLERMLELGQAAHADVLQSSDNELFLVPKVMHLGAARNTRAPGNLGSRGPRIAPLVETRDGGLKQTPARFRAAFLL